MSNRQDDNEPHKSIPSEFRLKGDKINLELRPASKLGTASSKCAALLTGNPFLRPVSTIPLLTLDKVNHFVPRDNDDDPPQKGRRPFSADYDGHRDIRAGHHRNTIIDGGQEGKHFEFASTKCFSESVSGPPSLLHSSILFKNLLSEPIKSWRNGPIPNSLDETTTADATSASKQSSCDDLSGAVEIFDNSPKLPSPENLFDSTKYGDNSTSSNGRRAATAETSFQCKNDLDRGGGGGGGDGVDEARNETVTRGDDSGMNAIHDYLMIKYEAAIERGKLENSTQTNAIGDNKFAKEMINTNKNNPIQLFPNTTKLFNCPEQDNNADLIVLNNRNIIGTSCDDDDDGDDDDDDDENLINGLPNLSEIDIDDLFKSESDRRFDNFFRATENPQKISREKPSNRDLSKKATPVQDGNVPTKLVPILMNSNNNNNKENNGCAKQKVKFVAKPIKQQPAYEGNHTKIDVESWMSKNEGTIEDDVTDKCYDKKPVFSEFLETIEELTHSNPEEIPTSARSEPLIEERSSSSGSLDDLTSILQVLEEEGKKSHKKIESIKEIVHDVLPSDGAGKIKSVSFSDDEKSLFDKKLLVSSNQSHDYRNLNSSTNYTDLVSFLDEVDRDCSHSYNNTKIGVLPKTNELTSFKLHTIPKLDELMLLPNKELAQFVIDLSLRVKDKSSSIALLRDELASLRAQIINEQKKSEQSVKQKLKQQKEECDATVKRHQKFIDQLIRDKKTLGEQCDGLVKEVRSLDERHKANAKALEHKHDVEMHKLKEMHLAGEKIKRDRWVESKTQKIKELTVKSIEPELQSMEKRQQQELSDLRMLHRREIEDLELRHARRMQEECENIRMKMTEEREKILAHEREVIRIRYEQMVESEENGYQKQRKRLVLDHARRIAECEEREATITAEKDKSIKLAREEFEDKLQAIIRKHHNEIKSIKDHFNLDMDEWKNNFKKQQNVKLAEKESAMKEQYRKERDREIERVIERLEAEATESKNQLEQSTENRIRRLKEKYEKEIQDLEVSEKQYKEKYSITKQQVAENDEIIIDLKTALKQLQIQLQESRETSAKLLNEREEIRDVIKKDVKNELEQLQEELAVVKGSRDKELQQIYSRVKMSVARKDEILIELSKDHKSLQEKCVYLEKMLEQQRKEYLIK